MLESLFAVHILTFHGGLVLPDAGHGAPGPAAAGGHGRFQFQNRGSVLEDRPAAASTDDGGGGRGQASSAFLDHLGGRGGPFARTISCLSSGLSRSTLKAPKPSLFLSLPSLPPDEQLTNYLFTLK